MSKLIDKLTQFRTVHNECKHNYVLRRTICTCMITMYIPILLAEWACIDPLTATRPFLVIL